jgi:hypothetical protein
VSSAHPERRVHSRRPFLTTGSNPVVATIGILPRAALVCDLSVGGIGLLVTDPPPVGSIVPVWLAVPPGSPSRLLLVRVVYVQEEANELFRLGLSCLDEAAAIICREMLAYFDH